MRSFDSEVLNKSFVFSQWTLQGDGLLLHDAKAIHLPPKEMRVLYLLLDAAGSVLSKDWLLDKVWPNCDVHEGSLSRCIYVLRKLFGRENNFIKTIYGNGYRFEVDVDVVEYGSFSAASSSAPLLSILPSLVCGDGCGLELQGRLISRLAPVLDNSQCVRLAGRKPTIGAKSAKFASGNTASCLQSAGASIF